MIDNDIVIFGIMAHLVNAFAMRPATTSALSCARFNNRRSSSAVEGGKIKILTKSWRARALICCVPASQYQIIHPALHSVFYSLHQLACHKNGQILPHIPEIPLIYFCFKGHLIDKEIILAFDLAWAAAARCGRYRHG